MVQRPRWAAVLCLVALSACSYVMLDRPPRAVRRGDTYPACTTDDTYPHVDIGVGVALVFIAAMVVTGAVQPDAKDGEMGTRELTGTEKAYVGATAVIEAGLFALSARHGYDMIRQCRALQGRAP